MKKPLLISATLFVLALSATSIYAQVTTGSSIVDKMKAAAHSFTLSSVLNPTDTGLQSSPVKGKKTGDILTAGEWNRVLELVSEGGSGGGSGWVDVPLSGTDNFDESCIYRFKTQISGRQPYVGGNPYYYPNAVAPTQLVWWFEGIQTYHISASSKTVFRLDGAVYSPAGSIVKIEKLCGGGGGTTTVAGGGAEIVEGGIIKTSAKTISNWDLITLEGSWNSGGGDAAPTGGYIYKLGGQAKLSYVEASGISKDITLTTTAQNVHNLTVKLSGNDVVIDPSSTNTLAYVVWKLGGGSGSSASSNWVDVPLTDTADFDINCEYRISFPSYGSGSATKPAVKQYAWAIYAAKIEFGDAGTNDYPVYIPKNDKANYYHPSYGKITSWSVAPSKIEKRCN